MSESVTIKNGEAITRTNEPAGVRSEHDRVVPLNSPHREGSGVKITSHDGSMETDGNLKARVTVDSSVPKGLDIRDQHDRLVHDTRNVDLDKTTIKVGKTRCSLRVAMDMGLVEMTSDGLKEVEGGYERAKGSEQKTENTQQSTRETFVTAKDQETLNQIHSRVSPSVVDSYMHNVIGCMMSGQPADTVVQDMALAVGAEPTSLCHWTEQYINNMMDQALDATVRNSNGSLSSDEIMEHVDKCSPNFKRQLLLSLHLGSNSMIHQLIQIVKAGKIV